MQKEIGLFLFCLMRQNRHSILAFPKFNKALSILPSEAKVLLVLFCHLQNPIGWIGLVTRTIHLDQRKVHLT